MSTANYLNAGLLFKMRKVARYIRLYGFGRTIVKVATQIHLSRADPELRADIELCNRMIGSGITGVGIIGCGAFSYAQIAYYVCSLRSVSLVGVMDRRISRAESLGRKYRAQYATEIASRILEDPRIQLIFIASNHASHATYAIQCLDAGKSVHIEKPHVVSENQLVELMHAMRRNPSAGVFLGFNRPKSRLFKKLTGMLAAEDGPMMINWFVAGHEIDPDHWYFNESEGGRLLGNVCHWTDLTLAMVGQDKALPIRIEPMGSGDSGSDYVTGLRFGDGSQAVVTFSAKGHTFEGVREVLNVHKGSLLAEIKDFQILNADRAHRKVAKKLLFRDHGHSANIYNSVNGLSDPSLATSAFYVWLTAKVFLGVKESHDKGRSVSIHLEDYPLHSGGSSA